MNLEIATSGYEFINFNNKIVRMIIKNSSSNNHCDKIIGLIDYKLKK